MKNLNRRQMLRALVGGATDAVALAELARGRMRKKIPQLEQALSGHFAAHQQFLVAQQLVHIEGLEAVYKGSYLTRVLGGMLERNQ